MFLASVRILSFRALSTESENRYCHCQSSHILQSLTWNSLLSKSKVSSSSASIIVVILMNDRLIISLNAIQAQRVGLYPFQRLWKEKQKYNIIIVIPLPSGLDVSPLQGTWLRGGGTGRSTPPFSHTLQSQLPFFFLGFLPLALYSLQNIEHCCIVPFPTSSPSSPPFSTPTFVPLSLAPSVPILSPSVPACPSPVLPHWFVWNN